MYPFTMLLLLGLALFTPRVFLFSIYHDQRQWVIIGIDRKVSKTPNKTHDPRFWSILESRYIHSKSRSVVVITIITISKAILKAQEIVYMIFGTWHNRPFLHIIIIIIIHIFLFRRATANLCACFSLKPIGVCFLNHWPAL